MKRILYIPFDHLHRNFGALKDADSKNDVIALVESALVRIRAYNYNKVGAVNYSNVFTINISVRKPIISTTTSSVISLNTKYGSASPIDTINLSGQYIIQNISVTAPSGFEVSNSTSAGFKNKVTISQSGTNVAFTKVYIRLASTANVGNFSGNVILSSDAADTTRIPITTSYVAPAPLNITAKYFQKFYLFEIRVFQFLYQKLQKQNLYL